MNISVCIARGMLRPDHRLPRFAPNGAHCHDVLLTIRWSLAIPGPSNTNGRSCRFPTLPHQALVDHLSPWHFSICLQTVSAFPTTSLAFPWLPGQSFAPILTLALRADIPGAAQTINRAELHACLSACLWISQHHGLYVCLQRSGATAVWHFRWGAPRQ